MASFQIIASIEPIRFTKDLRAGRYGTGRVRTDSVARPSSALRRMAASPDICWHLPPEGAAAGLMARNLAHFMTCVAAFRQLFRKGGNRRRQVPGHSRLRKVQARLSL